MTFYHGMFITTFADTGPVITYNSSALSYERVLNLGVQGLTALQLGEDETLYGPLPTHQADLIGIVFTLKISVRESMDERIRMHGRPTNIWMLFRRSGLKIIFNNWEQIESELRNIIHKISLRSDEDLVEEKFAELDRKVRVLFEPLLDEGTHPREGLSSNRTSSNVPEYITNDVQLGDLLVDHQRLICYLFTSTEQIKKLLDERSSLDELYDIQELVRARYGQWYALRVIINPRDQAYIKKQYSKHVHEIRNG